jgi:O-antigen/teichoic acid export membrane protein
MSSLRSIGKDVALYLPGKLVPALMAVIAVPLFSRFFSPEEYGRYDLTFRVALFLIVLTMNWLDNVILRFHPAAQQSGEERPFAEAVGLIRVAGAAAGLAAIGGLYLLGPEAVFGSIRDLLWLGALVFLAQALFGRGLAMLRAHGRALAYSVATSVNAVARVALGLVLAIPLGFGVHGLLWSMVLAPMALYAVYMRGLFVLPPLRPDDAARRLTAEALRYGVPVGVTMVLTYSLSNLDRFLLKAFAGDAAVGVYAVGSFVGDEPMTLIYSTLMLAVFPTTARHYETAGHAATEAFNRHLTRMYLLVAAPVLALLAALAEPAMRLVAGAEFQPGWVVIPWVAAAGFTIGLSQYGQLGLHLTKRTWPLVWVSVAAVAVNIAVNLLLIPRLGFVACGVSRLITALVLLAAFAVVGGRVFQWHFPWLAALRVGLAAGAAAGAALGAQQALAAPAAQLAAGSALAALAYAGVLLATGEVTRHEIRETLAAVKRRLGRG